MKLDKRSFAKISILTGILVIGFVMATVVTSSDNSLPHSMWMRKIVNTGYERDEYVLIRFNMARLIKQIKCLPGDYLENVDNCFYCYNPSPAVLNGIVKPLPPIKLGCAKLFDRIGNPTSIFQYSGVIPDFSYFVIGEHPDSYDSRYIGLINSGMIEDALWVLK